MMMMMIGKREGTDKRRAIQKRREEKNARIVAPINEKRVARVAG